jgi:hypothetical protein
VGSNPTLGTTENQGLQFSHFAAQTLAMEQLVIENMTDSCPNPGCSLQPFAASGIIVAVNPSLAHQR